MILSRVRLIPQIRYDLEDFLAQQSAVRTDNKFWTKQFLSERNFIVKGFTVTGLSLTQATIEMDDATLIHADNTNDFSWFTSEETPTDIIIAASDLTSGVKNYIELQLTTETNTSATKAFWDPAANAGAGAEFNQEIDTITDLVMNVDVRTGSFSGSADRLPLAIIEVDGGGNIVGILDKRRLFFRLGATSPTDVYSWASQTEPPLALTLSSVTGTYVVGETVTFSSGATATVSTGGTTSIQVQLPSSDALAVGDTVTGGSSSATGTLETYNESFTGADKDLDDFRVNDEAIKTELKSIKGTSFWYEASPASMAGILQLLNSVIAPISSGAKYSWSGSALSITDDDGSPADADVVARVRLFGYTGDLDLTRQDGTGGSSALSISDGEILYVTLPSSGGRIYSSAGSGATNFKTAARASFTNDNTQYWLAYREGSKLIVRGTGELESGETAEISDNIPSTFIDKIGLSSETADPAYSSNIRGTTNESIVARSGVLTDAIGDEQEDRSGFIYSESTVTWDGTDLTFADNIVLELVNTKSGTTTQHTVLAAGSPISLADGESAYVSIDRTQASENVSIVLSGTTPIPAQTQADKDIFVLFKRKDSGGSGFLYIPFHKQVIEPGQTVRLGASGSGSGSSGTVAQEALTVGTTTHTVTFAVNQLTTDYIAKVQLINLTDANPQFQELIVTAKTLSGFTVKWNAPLDTGNYLIGYHVPNAQTQIGEEALSTSDTEVTITLPIPLTGTSYVPTARFVNYTDASPQFQPTTVTAKTATTFTVKWNGPLDSNNYRMAFDATEYL